jgi:hypothetical protein
MQDTNAVTKDRLTQCRELCAVNHLLLGLHLDIQVSKDPSLCYVYGVRLEQEPSVPPAGVEPAQAQPAAVQHPLLRACSSPRGWLRARSCLQRRSQTLERVELTKEDASGASLTWPVRDA